jgi:hypothetical protein
MNYAYSALPGRHWEVLPPQARRSTYLYYTIGLALKIDIAWVYD